MLRTRLGGCGEGDNPFTVGVLECRGVRGDELHDAARDRAGLIDDDGIDRPGVLEDFATLDDHTELGPSPRADHDPEGGGEAERTRAGDDQHGDCGGHGVARRVAETQPGAERDDGGGDRERHEEARHSISESLYLSSAALGLVDESDDLGERSIGADPGRFDDQSAVGGDRGADDIVSRACVDRNRLAGDHRGVDRAMTIDDDSIGGDLLSRGNEETHADVEIFGGDFRTVLETSSLGAEIGKCSDGIA